MPIRRKHVPDMRSGWLLVMGHAPDLGSSLCALQWDGLLTVDGSRRGDGELDRRPVSTEPTLTV